MRVSKKESKNKKKEKLTGTIKDYPLVEVKWNDATGESGWMDINKAKICLLYTSPSPRDNGRSRMPSSA